MRVRLLLAIMAGFTASAARAEPAFIQFGPVADAPQGFVEMCKRSAADCAEPQPQVTLPWRGADPLVEISIHLASTFHLANRLDDVPSGLRPMGFSPKRAVKGFERPSFLDIGSGQTEDAHVALVDASTGSYPLPAGAEDWHIYDGFAKFVALASSPLTDVSAIADRLVRDPLIADTSGCAEKWFADWNFALAQPQLAAATLPATDQAVSMGLVMTINRRVNHNVHQRTDVQTYGVDEYWTRAGEGRHAVGDCEDIALEKRSELLKAGVSTEHLFLAAVFKPHMGLHTVLLVRMPDGDYVLDNLELRVLPWRKARLVWLRVQAPDHPTEWHRLAAI